MEKESASAKSTGSLVAFARLLVPDGRAARRCVRLGAGGAAGEEEEKRDWFTGERERIGSRFSLQDAGPPTELPKTRDADELVSQNQGRGRACLANELAGPACTLGHRALTFSAKEEVTRRLTASNGGERKTR